MIINFRKINGETDWEIKCADCDDTIDPDQSIACNVPFEMERFLSSQFRTFVTMSPSERCVASNNFTSFANHTKFFNSNTTAKIWLPFIKDENKKIRANVGKATSSVMRNKTRFQKEFDRTSQDFKEYQKLVLQVLVEALENALEVHDLDLHITILKTAEEMAR